MQRLLVLGAIALFSGIASASSVIAEVSGVNPQISAIQLKDNGQLVIDSGKTSQVIQLSDENSAELVQLARIVADAELTVERRKVICKMMVPFRHDLLVGKSERTLKLVLTTRSCAFSEVVAPKEEWDLRSAIELKASMTALALQLVRP